LHGALGRIRADGVVTLQPPHYGADGLVLDFGNLDLSMLAPGAPATQLTGQLLATGTIDSLRPPEGWIALALAPGTVREFSFDSAAVRLTAAGGRIHADTLFLLWPDGRLDGDGDLGWSRPDSGQLTLTAGMESLAPFDSLLTALAGPADTTDSLSHWLDGSGEVGLTLTGSLDSLRGVLDAAVHDVLWRHVRSPGAGLHAEWTTGGRRLAAARLTFDSVSVGEWSMLDGDADISGYADSLAFAGGVDIGRIGRVATGGQWWQTPLAHGLLLDSLSLDLASHRWELQEPVRALLGDSLIAISPFRLLAADGAGDLKIAGLVPRAAGGAFQLSVNNLPMLDIYGLIEKDGSQVSGTLSADLDINGTADRPDIRGSLSLADASFGDFSAPFLQGILRYEDHRLDANLFLWKTGSPVMAVEAALPLDLALHPVPQRQIEGPLLVRAHSDSTDLGVLEAFIRTVRQVRGALAVDAEIRGTWAAPLLSGYLAVANAAMTIPALGVRYTEINGAATFRGDSVILDSLRLVSGKGTLAVGGGFELRRLRHPILDVTLSASRFLAMDVRSLATLVASGELRLQGPVRAPLLTGQVTADEGSYHFADLVTKRVVDLENPGDTTLIDLEQLRRQKLGASFVTRFLDSLAIRDLRVTMGESFWLRSTEANIQLAGTIDVDKVRNDYRVDGTLQTVRGRYNLYAGPFVKDFTVERGTVRYYGNPSLNADLDIEAKHVVRTWDGEDLPVTAQITGTMLAPKVALSSEATAGHGTLSTTELFSYLMFGRASLGGSDPGSSSASQSQEAMLSTALTYFSSALSSELQRTLVTDLRLPIDYIEIKAGNATRASTATQTGAVQVAQVAAGWRLGRQVFVTVRADICTNQTRFYPDVEYRFNPQFRVRTTLEPVWSCTDFRTGQSNLDSNKYQLGLDFLWEREF
ncbi:MAG: translocation/assembly module TamB domain-containing protein, partial [Gemmatimonadales bacterium]